MQKALLDRMALYLAVTLVQTAVAGKEQEMGAGHLEHGHGQVGVQDDRHHGGDEWKPIAADHSGCHAPCRQHLGAGGGQEEGVVGAQHQEDEACGGAAQAVAEGGHIWVLHREGNGGLDVRLIQPRRFFMFTL